MELVELIELIELIKQQKKNNYINRWKNYYSISDAFNITIIFEYQFNLSIAGLREIYKEEHICSSSF